MARVKLFINGTQKTVIHSKLEKQGERSIDQLKAMLPANVGVEVNDKVLLLQDFVDVYSLSSIYNFQNSVKDESGNANHGTATDISFGYDDWDGYSAVFNGTSSKVTIPDDNSIDLSAEFHIYIWAKWTSTSSGSLFSRSPLKINVNATTAGDVKVILNTDTVTSSTAGYNDGNWHLVEIKRAGTLVTLSIDDVSKGTVTSNVDLSASTSYEIGHESSAGYFDGSISRLRIYKGDTLSSEDSTKIFAKRNPRSTLKFGGYVTKIENILSQKDIVALSFGKILGETEVRSTVYDNKTPEYIVNDLISSNTTFTFTTGVPSGLILTRYTADGKLIDIIRDLATYSNSTFFTTGSEELFFVPKSYTETTLVFTHGTDSKINKSGFDDSEIVNDLTVLGENKKYNTTELISSNGNDLIYTLERNANSTLVKIGGVEQTPDEAYTLDSLGRIITFTSAPAAGTDNISVEYEYELPLYFRGQRQSSIAEFGVHAKRVNAPWITNRTDGIRFINSYLNRYKDITEKIMIELGYFFNAVEEGDVVQVINSVKEISGDFMVKSIQWNYPSMTTQIEVGEYYFGYFESDKQIVQKLHDLEGAVTANKTLIDFESPEEVLPEITDAIIQIVSQNFTESLSITQSDTIREMQAGSYGATRYGSRRLPLTVNSGSVYTSG